MSNVQNKINSFFDNPRNRSRFLIASILFVLVVAGVVLLTGREGFTGRKTVYVDSARLLADVAAIDLDAQYYNKRIRGKTKAFYKLNEYQTKWLNSGSPNSNYKAFVSLVAGSADYGLNPEHYHMEKIREEVGKLYTDGERKKEQVAKLDMKITAAFFLFTTHLIEGRIRTAGYGEYIWKRNLPKENDVRLLAENSSGEIREIIEELHPRHDQYEKMRQALREYRELAEKAKPELVSSSIDSPLKPGQKHRQVPSIRQRLFLTDLEKYKPGEDSLVYDEKLADAVRKFQKRHGLVADGIISSVTIKHLKTSFEKRARIIELNLERLRWLPDSFPKEYISINVPDYSLTVYNNEKEVKKMRVVLGDEFNATPVFTDTLEYLVFSPTWTVPPGIMEEEVIPNLRENSLAYDTTRFTITRNGERIDPTQEDWSEEDLDPANYLLVEKPNPENSLGLVKFMMPNDLNIYLHDTPAERLFKRNKRAYSHGCIRLEDPLWMADYLLQDQRKWNREKMREAMEADEPVNVPLKRKVPVQIEYQTAWVDSEGRVHFRDDIYGHDERQLAQLNRL